MVTNGDIMKDDEVDLKALLKENQEALKVFLQNNPKYRFLQARIDKEVGQHDCQI